MTPTVDHTSPIQDTDIFPRTLRMLFVLNRNTFMAPRLRGSGAQVHWNLLSDLLERFGPGIQEPEDVPNGGLLGMLALIRPAHIKERGLGLMHDLISRGTNPWQEIHPGQELWRRHVHGPVALQIIESRDTEASLACLSHPNFPGWASLKPKHMRLLVEGANAQRILDLVALGGAESMAQYTNGSRWSMNDTATLAISDPGALDVWLEVAASKGLLDRALPGAHASDIAKAIHGSGKREQVLRKHCMEHILGPGVSEIVGHMALKALDRGDRRNYGAWCGVGRDIPSVSRIVLDKLQQPAAGVMRDTVKMIRNGTIKHDEDDILTVALASFATGARMQFQGQVLWQEGDANGQWLLEQARQALYEQDDQASCNENGTARPLKAPEVTPNNRNLIALSLLGLAGFPGGAKALSRDADEARSRVDARIGNGDLSFIEWTSLYCGENFEKAIETEFNGLLPQCMMTPLALRNTHPSPGEIRMAVLQLRCAAKRESFDEALSRSWDKLAYQLGSRIFGASQLDTATIEHAAVMQNWRVHMEQMMLNERVEPVSARTRPGPRF